MATSRVEASQPPATAETAVEKVRVRITSNRSGSIKIDCSHPVPPLINVLKHLPKAARDYISQYGYESYSIREAIPNISTDVCSFQQWQEAIAQTLMECIAKLVAQKTEPTEMSLFTKPGYLTLGDGIYKLHPVGVSRINGALKALRRKITDQTTEECERMLKEARDNARGVEQVAAERLVDANRCMEEARVALAQRPPTWAVNACCPLMQTVQGNLWKVGFYITFAINWWEYQWKRRSDNGGQEMVTRKWVAQSAASFPCLLWATLADSNGTYNVGAIHADKASPALPHINTRACMTLASAPIRLRSMVDLNALAAATQYCMHGVSLHSLLSDRSSFDPRILAFAPPALKAVVLGADWDRVIQTAAIPNTIETVAPVEQDANETWTANV